METTGALEISPVKSPSVKQQILAPVVKNATHFGKLLVWKQDCLQYSEFDDDVCFTYFRLETSCKNLWCLA